MHKIKKFVRILSIILLQNLVLITFMIENVHSVVVIEIGRVSITILYEEAI